ncbi:hypothetical protein [Mediterraneibacter agrestimuris]|uniref:hypothetical protein n=1 Tax=Mediterraneibacter agrestimuris TaxID=2941333 RepID=UPI00203BB407|nr:hypothetical protein [Mediterraneibacter agrestimuris]
MGNNDEKKIRPQDKWDKKAGVAAKTYKVNAETAEEFKEACKAAGISMGTQLSKMMREFIDDVNQRE